MFILLRTLSLPVLNGLDLLLYFSLFLLNLKLQRMRPFLELVFFKFEQRLLLEGGLQLAPDFVDFLLIVLLTALGGLDVVRDIELVLVDLDLVGLVIVALLAQLLPGRLGILCDHLCSREFLAYALDFVLHFVILVLDVGDHANALVLKHALLLQLVPLVLEDVHGLGHFELGQEVADEVVDHNRMLGCLCGHSIRSHLRVPHGRLFELSVFKLSLGLERVEVIQILVVVVVFDRRHTAEFPF